MFARLGTAALSLYVKKTPSLFNIYRNPHFLFGRLPRNPHFLKIACLPKGHLHLEKLLLLIGTDKSFPRVDVAQQGRIVEKRGTYEIFPIEFVAFESKQIFVERN